MLKIVTIFACNNSKAEGNFHQVVQPHGFWKSTTIPEIRDVCGHAVYHQI